MTINEIFEAKFTHALEDWCNTFKLIGFHHETPRYSQIYCDEIKPIKLYSTQKDFSYNIELTSEERIIIFEAFVDGKLWDYWKEFRTAYLIKNHPTIKPY